MKMLFIRWFNDEYLGESESCGTSVSTKYKKVRKGVKIYLAINRADLCEIFSFAIKDSNFDNTGGMRVEKTQKST